MENNRKILHAKRRVNSTTSNSSKSVQPYTLPHLQNNNNNTRNDNNGDRKGIKRVHDSPKNIANERLKKLRKTLAESVQKQSEKPSGENSLSSCSNSKKVNIRPRPIIKRPLAVSESAIGDKRFRTETRSTSTNVFDPNTISETVPKEFKFASSTELSRTCIYPPKNDELDRMEWDELDHFSSDTVITNNSVSNFQQNNALTDNSHLYVVVDTNIFISHLSTIKKIVELNSLDNYRPIIYIPWMVVEELDELKQNNLRYKAQEANKFIYKLMHEKGNRIQGQTVSDAMAQNDAGASATADDKILGCCLQLKSKGENLILLTDDVNLKIKAQINSIETLSNEEMMNRINVSVPNINIIEKSKQILASLGSLLAEVIDKFILEAYGNHAKHMDGLKQPPKTIEDCLNIFTKYWFPVFSNGLTKHCKKCLDNLNEYLTSSEVALDDLASLCIRICVHMKDVKDCKQLAGSVIDQIEKIRVIQPEIL